MKYLKSQYFKLFHTRIPIPSCLKSKNLAILGQNLQRQYKIMAVLFKMTHALPNCFMAFFLEIYFMWKAELHRGRDRVWPISQSWARLKLGAWSLELHLSLPPAWQGPGPLAIFRCFLSRSWTGSRAARTSTCVHMLALQAGGIDPLCHSASPWLLLLSYRKKKFFLEDTAFPATLSNGSHSMSHTTPGGGIGFFVLIASSSIKKDHQLPGYLLKLPTV